MRSKELLKQEIKQAEADGLLAITEESGGMIETDDFELDKTIAYRLDAPDEAWYAGRIKFVSDRARALGGHLETQMASLLASLEPDMTRTLSAVYLAAGEADSQNLCEASGASWEEIPDTVLPEDGDGALGCLWSDQCAVILDLEAIRKTADGVCSGPGAYMDPASEFDIGVFTTLTHEIYHLAEADPFLELKRNVPEETAAEEYGVQAYESWKYGHSGNR